MSNCRVLECLNRPKPISTCETLKLHSIVIEYYKVSTLFGPPALLPHEGHEARIVRRTVELCKGRRPHVTCDRGATGLALAKDHHLSSHVDLAVTAFRARCAATTQVIQSGVVLSNWMSIDLGFGALCIECTWYILSRKNICYIQ